MAVKRLVSVAMVEHNATAIAAVPIGVDNDAVRRRFNARSYRSADIDPGVHGPLARKRIAPVSVSIAQPTGDGPCGRQYVEIGAGKKIPAASRQVGGPK